MRIIGSYEFYFKDELICALGDLVLKDGCLIER
jgi:hypothetical protein